MGSTTVLAVSTRFGEFTADPSDVVSFDHGLPGFEACRRFVIVSAPALGPFTCLHGIDEPGPSFLTLNPMRVDPAYVVAMSDADRRRLGAGADETLLWLAVVHLDEQSARVNLKAPIVVNPRTMRGMQLMSADTDYAVDHRLDGV